MWYGLLCCAVVWRGVVGCGVLCCGVVSCKSCSLENDFLYKGDPYIERAIWVSICRSTFMEEPSYFKVLVNGQPAS